jgi:hypothetical protein
MGKISRQDKAAASENVLLKYLIVLAGAGALYALTCAPTILWQDSGRFVYRIWHNDIQDKLGLALSHPLYIMIGIGIKHIPIGELAYRINLISAVFGAVAVANVFLLLWLWLGRSLPAVIAAITFALSHTFWWHAGVAETYALYTALLTGELIMLLRYMQSRKVGYLYWLGLLNGLAIADHMWGSLALACYAVFFIILLAKKQIGLKHFGIVVLLWVIGAAPYEYLIIKNIIVSGDVVRTLASAAFGNGWQGQVLNTSVSMKMVFENIIFILLNFPTPNLVFFFVGLWVLWKAAPSRSFANIIIAMLILYFLFAFRYTVPDRYAFFMPFYCMVSIFIGLGVYVVHKRMSSRVFVCLVLIFAFLPVAVYAAAPIIVEKVGFNLGTKREIPYRNGYRYFLCPWKTGYRGADRFANEALALVENNAIIYADSTTAYVLLYIQQVREKRRDVKIVSAHDSSEGAPVLDENTVAGLMANSALYVVSPVKGYCLPFLLERYDFVRVSVLWKVVERKAKDDISAAGGGQVLG